MMNSVQVRIYPAVQSDAEGNPSITGAATVLEIPQGERKVVTVGGMTLAVIADRGNGETCYVGEYVGAKGWEISNGRIDWNAQGLL